MKYTCKYKLYHDKEVLDNEPSSNNGWIYTAYARALGHITANRQYYNKLAKQCYTNSELSDFYINRLPDRQTPPISRDELIGMISLKTDVYRDVFYHNFYFCKSQLAADVSVWDAIKLLFSIRNEHRNHIWENKLYTGYRLAFRLAWHDRYYMKEFSQLGFVKLYEYLAFNFYCFTTIIQNNTSAKNILWLQLYDLKSSFWIKFINQPKNFLKYFGKDHIFNRS